MNKSLQITGPTFDYAMLPSDLAEALRGQAGRIRERIKQTTNAIIETGRDLLAVKDQIDHGQFETWVEAELGVTPRTAQNYMKAAHFAEGKSETVSLLSPATIYRLSAKCTPPEIVEAVINRTMTGEIVPDAAVESMLVEGRFLKAEAKRKEREKYLRARREKDRKRNDDWIEENNRERQKAEAEAAAVAAEIIEKFGVDGARFLATAMAINPFKIIEQLRWALPGPKIGFDMAAGCAS